MKLDLSFAINLRDYDVSYTEFVRWAVTNGIEAYAVNAYGGNGDQLYFFQHKEDFTAFTLTYEKSNN